MKTFYIEGISGLLLLLVLLLTTIFSIILIPTWLMVKLWNMTIPFLFQGTTIGLYQGFLLWISIILLVYLKLSSRIHIEFKKIDEDSNLDPETIIQDIQSKKDD